MNSNNKQLRMDGETAMAFAGHEFEQRHPKRSCPEWLARCTTICYYKDQTGRYVVSFALTPKATNDAVSFFEVAVDTVTGETEVLLDRDFSEFSGDDLQGY